MKPATLTPSKRVQYLIKHRHDDHDRTQIPTRRPHYLKSYQEHAEEDISLRIAHGFAAFLAEKKILIREHDILAGFAYRYTYKPSSPFNIPDDYDPLFRPPAGIDTVEEAELGIKANGFAEDSKEAEEMRTFSKCVSKWLYKHWESGHIIPAFEKLINTGYAASLLEIDEKMPTASTEQKAALQSMRICTEAAINYIERYARMADELCQSAKNPEYKAQLEKMSQALKNIAGGKASSFYEAVQLIWLSHEMLYAENFPASLSFGRLDQYLYPFYKQDLASGAMTHAEAVDIIDALWVKFGITLHGYQNVTIGGVDVNGNDMCNELTVMMLQACRKTLFDQPLLCLRYNKNMPDEVWTESVALLETGIGLPAFFIDDFCIPAKERMGHSKEDAANYGLVGCVEMSCPGKEYAKTEALRVNVAKILEIMLFDGKSNSTNAATIIGNASMRAMASTEQSVEDYTFPLFSATRLSDITSFDQLLCWYKEELTAHMHFSMESINRLDSALSQCYPTPFLSVLMEGCVKNGMDVTAGGAIYNNSGVNLCGLANVADSLQAIRELVYEQKRYTLEDFKMAMQANFEGYDAMEQDILDCAKYGNDIDSVDLLMADIVKAATDHVESFTNPRGGRWQMGLYSVEDHAKMGMHTGALPDGKRNGEAMASAFSPVQGKDVIGPTAALNSLLKTDLTGATNGMVIDIKFTPSFFDKESHIKALRMLIDAYAEQGGGEIQFNVVKRQTLIEAQRFPEKHKNLVVRVSGFSAVFTSLIEETQNEIIKRTEYEVI